MPVQLLRQAHLAFGHAHSALPAAINRCLHPAALVLGLFAADILPLINATFVLVSHDGDEVLLPATSAAARVLLDDTRLLHWFE